MARRFQANSARVVYDTLDGEVIAIRNDTGAYYSMTGTAASIWIALTHGVDTESAAMSVGLHHGVAAGSVAADVGPALEDFADQLLTAELIVPLDAPPTTPQLELPPENAGMPWATPELQEFTDMADLLLFDPIHEVGPEGWPNAVTDGP